MAEELLLESNAEPLLEPQVVPKKNGAPKGCKTGGSPESNEARHLQALERRKALLPGLIEGMKRCGTITGTCRAIGFAITTGTLTDWMKDDPEFRKAMLEAKEEYIDALEELADERIRSTEYEARPQTLLHIFRLKSERPGKYRDNAPVVNIDNRQLVVKQVMILDSDGRPGQPFRQIIPGTYQTAQAAREMLAERATGVVPLPERMETEEGDDAR